MCMCGGGAEGQPVRTLQLNNNTSVIHDGKIWQDWWFLNLFLFFTQTFVHISISLTHKTYRLYKNNVKM